MWSDPEATTWQNLLEADVVVFVPPDLVSNWQLSQVVFSEGTLTGEWFSPHFILRKR